ncbi:PhzF family phenazine biosynthesis protein [Nakamurella sp.]|uniref:PhzF family phenazine biosynthesis protein n=1 Tax=Nakamurella sp. TaxID=1869182 RepID=UPI003784B102
MTAPRARAFAQVDVFSETPLRGNPVAVVLDAAGLSDQTMAAFARWTNLSETAFLLPGGPDADYRWRVFTPERELPFAGHPTLGSAHAWLEHGGVPRTAGRVVQDCAAGLVELTLTDGRFAFAAPPTVRSGPVEDALLADVGRALGVDRAEVLDHQWVDNGPGWLAVRLASAERVLALEPDFTDLPDIMVGVLGDHPAGSPHLFEIRGFAVGAGIVEDPVTGSLNASVAQWLIGTGQAPTSYTATQGTRLGRAGVVHIDAGTGSAGDDTVWVGGTCTTVIRGTVTL